MDLTAYDALRGGAAWFEIEGRGRIRATGEDRVRLLHALATNHVQALAAGQGCYSFFLNAQGRVLADAHIFALEDALLIDSEAGARERLLAHIDGYIIADDVALEDVSERMNTTALEGPRSAEVLEKVGAPAPAEKYGIAAWEDGYIARVSRTAADGFWILGVPEAGVRLAAAGAVPADADAVETVRIENARPLWGVDFSDGQIAHETGQLDAVHFNKGCYLGQEIVERVRSRGHVNRRLTALEIEATAAPERGAKVMAGDKEAGEISSAAYSPALGKVVAMALLRTELGAQPFTVGGLPARATVATSAP